MRAILPFVSFLLEMQTTDVQSCLNGLKYIDGCLLSNKGGFMVRLYCMYRRLVYYRKEELILLPILLLMTVNFRGGKTSYVENM